MNLSTSFEQYFGMIKIMSRVKSYFPKGFTLIELLVVVSIVGVLATLASFAFGGARVRARDTKRLSDIRAFQKALELYAATEGHYPITSTWTSFDAPSYMVNGILNPAAASLTEAMQPHVNGLKDPKRGTPNDAGYLYLSNGASAGQHYCILFYKTPENMNFFPSGMIEWSRCGSVDSAGQCSGNNAIYIGSGPWATGC